jgi:hypothetical protein
MPLFLEKPADAEKMGATRLFQIPYLEPSTTLNLTIPAALSMVCVLGGHISSNCFASGESLFGGFAHNTNL